METKQTAQMVTWLDEERRKDKALISKLEERTISQSAIIEDQARRIQKVEAELASVRSTVLPQSVIDEAITRIRTELAASVEQVNGRRETAEAELKRQRDTDREMTMRAIEEMRQEFVTRLERELQVRRQEEERLSRIATELQSYASNLSKGLEEFERSLTFLEEQRRQDSRRLSDMSGEVVELAKRTEGVKQKIDLLEDLSRRNERSITQISGEMIEAKQQRQAWAEQEALAGQQREQVMAEMMRRIEGFNDTMEGHAKQVASWADMHRTMKKQIEDFDRIADRADRRLNEVAEVQRLSEERFRQEWEEWLQDDQKRWRQFTLTNEEARREQQRSMDDIQGQMLKQAELMQLFTEYIKRLRSNQQELTRGLAGVTQTLRETVEDSMTSLPPLS
jgi:hypothetical protein